MKIKKYLPFIIGAIVIIGALVLLSVNKVPSMILFYGDTCPHCKNVEAYMEENGTKEKLSFRELEVYNNRANAQLLTQKAKSCGMDTSNGVGVPFLYTDGQCIIGDEPIIEYFKNATQQ